MKRVICISGDAASGKTTASRSILARLPGWEAISTGQLFREYCREHGIDPQRISTLSDELHRTADDQMRQALTERSRIVAEARLAGFLARGLDDALRIFCDCPLQVRAERFRRREPQWSAEEAERLVAERDDADWNKLQKLYGADYRSPDLYHLVLRTDLMAPEQIAAAVLDAAGLTAE